MRTMNSCLGDNLTYVREPIPTRRLSLTRQHHRERRAAIGLTLCRALRKVIGRWSCRNCARAQRESHLAAVLGYVATRQPGGPHRRCAAGNRCSAGQRPHP